MIRPPCPSCNCIHVSTDARAVGRFSNAPTTYVAAHAGTPPRATREEAEADECQWRQTRRPHERRRLDYHVEEASLFEVIAPVVNGPSLPEFPAATMETAAREKAWTDFLAEVHMSLLVWEVDEAIRSQCEHVTSWMRRCGRDLAILARLDGVA